jgi:hypothetical protein
MKHLFTSYYNKNMHSPMAYAISATVKPYIKEAVPNLKRYTDLAPPWLLVDMIIQGQITADEYDSLYIEKVLMRLNPDKVVADLPDGAILLCYEKPEDHCHRHLVAGWIEMNTDTIVTEWRAPPTPSAKSLSLRRGRGMPIPKAWIGRKTFPCHRHAIVGLVCVLARCAPASL